MSPKTSPQRILKSKPGAMLLCLMLSLSLTGCGLFQVKPPVVKVERQVVKVPASLTQAVNLPDPLPLGSTNGQLWDRMLTLETRLNQCNNRLADVQAWTPGSVESTTAPSQK